jgi:hypothetical protein
MTRPCVLAGTMALVAALAAPAQAVQITEQTLIATGGDVVVTFVSNGAGYTSELYLDDPLAEDAEAIFNNWTTDIGASLNLGSFAAGTELVFKLLVLETGNIFYTGAGSRNADGIVHALVESVAGQVLVGFEDLFGGGDLDYDDLVFAFTNVIFTDDTTGGTGGTGGSSGSSGGGGTVGSGVVTGPSAGDVVQAGPGVGALPVAVDEPGTLLLLGSGLMMLVVVMRRQSVRR